MTAIANANLATAIPYQLVENPFCELEIHAKDHSNNDKEHLRDWHRSDAFNLITNNGYSYIGLDKRSSVINAYLTKDWECMKTGFYRINIGVLKHPTNTGQIKFYDGVKQIGKTINANYQWEHHEIVRFNVQYFRKGIHTLKIDLSGQAYVESIQIEKIDKYYWNSDGIREPGSEWLNIFSFDFTRNNLNQLNNSNIKSEWNDDYYNIKNDYLPLNFGYTDSITISVGEDASTAIPFFGGYLLYASPNKDKTELNFKGIDSLITLQLQQLYHNYMIGVSSSNENVNTQNYIQFGSVNELARYFIKTSIFNLNDYEIPYEMGFRVNFAGIYDFDTISTSGWELHKDLYNGMPAPCGKYILGNTVGSAESIIWQSSNTWNAAEFNMFFMHYYASGVGVRYPLEFDLLLRMHKANQTVVDAQDYIIRFTGKSDQNNIIGSTNPKLDGTWGELNFNLKSMFDNYVPSSEYNISKVAFIGEITEDMIINKKCSAIWADNIFSYKKINQAINYKSQNNVSSGLAEMQNLMDKSKHVAFVRAGKERCDDTVVVLPEEYELMPIMIDEVYNLIEIENWKNDPHSNNFQNQSHINFNFSQDKSGEAYYQDEDSIQHFWPLQTHSTESDINNQANADQFVQKNVLNNKDANKIGFSVIIRGSTQLDPAQMMTANVLSSRISGDHKIASMTYTFDKNRSPIFETKIDMNFPSDRRMLQNMQTRRTLINMGLINANQYYSGYIDRSIGNASPGGFNI